MKNTTLIFFLLLNYCGLGQSPKKIKPPAILINSLELKTEVNKGRIYYSRIENGKKLYNREYEVMMHLEINDTITNYNPLIHGEGKDYDFGLVPKGKFTGITEQGFFNNGYKNGFWKTKYKNKLVKTINYNNGLVIGKYRVYNMKGDLLYKTTFGSKGNGKYKDYYYNTGILKIEGNYEKEKKEGEWFNYNEQGELSKIEYYSDGELLTTVVK